MSKPIPIIDLFAGPGGLGEGFTSVLDEENKRVFKIALSIEKDDFAHKTLTLRSFVRQFEPQALPDEYYSFVRGEIRDVEELYKLYPEQAQAAKHEAWKVELGDRAQKITPHRVIDKRIKETLQGNKDFVLIGGPPCQAYSLVGRSRRQQADGLDENDPRVYLYREYYRILAVHQPPVFIMENVKGLLSAKVNSESVFNQIIIDLKNPFEAYKKLKGKEDLTYKPGYKIYSLVKLHDKDIYGQDIFEPRDFIIKSEEYGIPQARHRVILLGIRDDLDITPQTLHRHRGTISVNDVIGDLPKLRSGISKGKDSKEDWQLLLTESIENKVWEGVEAKVLERIIKVITEIKSPDRGRGGLFVNGDSELAHLRDWYIDEKLNGFSNHETRSHIKEDLYRYLFVSCFAEVNRRSPKLSDFPKQLLPKHLNIDKGISENKFGDRFRVQLSQEPSKTVTSHISKDGHYYIHPDPAQCRSLTVREAARIQTFPDNYYFCGPRTEQYHQVGNAVPPFLASQIARIILNIFMELC
ncbi:MAG TPA: DNA (cytosine-5-)-methyltransferase [Mucilaginibacter sp.]|jgi:DNA (cytosine-5)-methyltransferase 1|nr:DNA (cytosine-5-)-methyltransferase [Mucilaginibacter sp.]